MLQSLFWGRAQVETFRVVVAKSALCGCRRLVAHQLLEAQWVWIFESEFILHVALITLWWKLAACWSTRHPGLLLR